MQHKEMTAILEMYSQTKENEKKKQWFHKISFIYFDTFIDCKEFNLSSVQAIKIVSALNPS